MVVLICLSCPIKRGIKQDIGIPVPLQIELNKTNVTSTCGDYRKSNANKVSRFIKGDIGITGGLVPVVIVQDLFSNKGGLGLQRKSGTGIHRTLFILYRKILI